jgi:hypothetical protein
VPASIFLVELIYLFLNPIFDMCIIFNVNYFLVKCDIFINTFLMTYFINLKIKSVQYFRCNHKNKVYIYKYLHLYCVYKKTGGRQAARTSNEVG